MTYSRAQLYAAGEPLGEHATRQEGGRTIYGGGGGGGRTTTVPTIPTELKPLANLYVQQAKSLARTPWQGYTGQRFADLTGTQQLGIGMVQDRALNGSPVFDQASDTLSQVMAGGQTNPYLDSLVGRAQQSVVDRFNTMTKPQIEASMVNSGSFGNSGLTEMMQAQQKAAAQQMGDIASQMYGQAYETDRGRQMQALGMAPAFANQAYYDAGQLLNAGNLQQQQAQQNLDFGFQQYQDAMNYPFKQLQTIGGVVGQSTGSTTTSSGGGK